MKWFFNFIAFFCVLIFLNIGFLYAKEFEEVYIIEVGNINIGKLFWNIKLDKEDYDIKIKLQDKGFFSGLYQFEGSYEAVGKIKNSLLVPTTYIQKWKTKKKNRIVKILFENGVLKNLTITPKEKDLPRIKYVGMKNYLDPLSSFLNILMGEKNSKTIDGRRVYSMNIDETNNNFNKKISIDDYVNIWADHKRNDLKYIEIIQKENPIKPNMPTIIKIKFKKLTFKLTKI